MILLRPLGKTFSWSIDINFGTNSVMIKSAGNVGIGPTSPEAKLEVVGGRFFKWYHDFDNGLDGWHFTVGSLSNILISNAPGNAGTLPSGSKSKLGLSTFAGTDTNTVSMWKSVLVPTTASSLKLFVGGGGPTRNVGIRIYQYDRSTLITTIKASSDMDAWDSQKSVDVTAYRGNNIWINIWDGDTGGFGWITVTDIHFE